MPIRPLTAALGVILFIYGVIAAISPLPVGLPLAVIGVAMIAVAVPAFRPVFRRLRARWSWFNVLIHKAKERSPQSVREVIEETDPENTLEKEPTPSDKTSDPGR